MGGGHLDTNDFERSMFTGSPVAAGAFAIVLAPYCDAEEEAAKFLRLLAPYSILIEFEYQKSISLQEPLL
jgi:hypothetical protein